MSYSTNDKFYIDTDTSIVRFDGNMDLLNSIRFGKTDIDDGITFRANTIKDRLRENINDLKIYDNFTNSNQLTLDIQGLYTSNDQVTILLSARNNTGLYDGQPYYIYTSPTISYKIPGAHNLIIHSSLTSADDIDKNYLAFLGTRAIHLDYQTNDLSQEYYTGYFSGSISFSNSIYRIDEPTSFFVTKNIGYTLKLYSGNAQVYTNILFADESYYSSVISNNLIDISVGIYKNINSATSFKRFSQADFYTPNPSLPVSLNNYHIFILGHNDSTGISFLKYYKTQDTVLLQTFPKLLLVEDGNFITYFLTKTNDVSIPIYKYQTDASPAGYSFVQEDTSYSINGTSLGNTYEYIIHKLNASCVPLWNIRIVFTNINITIKDAIHIVYHSYDNSITVSIINNELTNIIIYNANNSSSIIQNVYNILLHFNSSGVFQWSIKKDIVSIHHVNKNSLISYKNDTFFAHYLYDVQNKNFINIYSSDGTAQNTIYKESNSVLSIDTIIYYDLLGKAQHDNYYQYSVQGRINSSNIYSYLSVLYKPNNSNNIAYSVINKTAYGASYCNISLSYTDGYSQTVTHIQSGNTIYNYQFNFNEDSIGQKQLAIGNEIRITKIVTDQVSITGNVVVNQDLTVDTVNINENIEMSSSSKIGIGKTPMESLDIIGNTIIEGNIGIGTNLQKAKLSIDAVNENAININNIKLINYPLPGFYNNGYILSGSRIPSIDSKYDVKVFPPQVGANYGNGTYNYTVSSDNISWAGFMFDKDYSLYWESAINRYSSSGSYIGAVSTVVSSVTYNGEWGQIELPKRLSMIKYRIYRGIVAANYFPKSWIIAGSDNGSTWTLVDSRSFQSAPASYIEYSINSAIQYKYYRMIITSIVGNNVSSVRVTEWELYLNNVNTVNYDEYEFKTVKYKARANTIYNYYYNDSNLYLPINLLDSAATGKFWRTSNLYTKTSDGQEAYLQIDIVNPIKITDYTLKGNNLLTYPSKWTLEGYTGATWTSIDSRDISSTTLSQLRNTYYTPENNLSTSNYRFRFTRNLSTNSNHIELATISFNTQSNLNVLHINSNNDITFRGTINVFGNMFLSANLGVGTNAITNTGGGLHIFAEKGSDTNGNSAQLIVENSSTNVGASDNDTRIVVKSKQTGESEVILYNDDDGVITWSKIGHDATNIYLQQGTSGSINAGTTVFAINTTTAYYPLANVGIRTSVPYAALDIHGRTGVAVTGDKQLYIAHYTTENYGWYIGNQTAVPTAADNDLYFAVNRNGTVTEPAYIQDNIALTQMNFTGQHKCFVDNMSYSNLLQYEGLIVSANQNKYIRMSNGIATGKDAITITESLPVVSITNTSNDKAVFGVISTIEDPNRRVEEYGAFVTILTKEKGDTRAHVNSLGEGGIWICDINGPLESGDYITSSCIPGYGMKQHDDLLHNYTVAKITMDCDFNPKNIPKYTIKKNPITQENELDDNGNIQWIEMIDENDNIIYETEYDIRYILNDGYVIPNEEYILYSSSNIIYKAAFVGCTYHCG